MADPVISDLFVGGGEGETALDHRVREEGGVEIDSEISFLCVFDPLIKILGLCVISFDLFIGDCIYCVEIDALFAGHASESYIKISHKLLGSGCLAGIVTGNLNTARECSIALKSVDIIALPAMNGNGNTRKLVKSCLGIHTVFGIDLFSLFVSVHNILLLPQCG